MEGMNWDSVIREMVTKVWAGWRKAVRDPRAAAQSWPQAPLTRAEERGPQQQTAHRLRRRATEQACDIRGEGGAQQL